MTENDDRKTMEPNSQKMEGLSNIEAVDRLADYFHEIPGEGTKIVVLVGGPASGKGELTGKLATKLGKTAVLGTDNYVKGNRDWRRKNVEDVGNDPIEKYDPARLNEDVRHILQLKDGEEYGIPIYDGKTGVAISEDPDHKPDHTAYIAKNQKVTGKQDFIIVEGDFQFLEPSLINRMIYLDLDDVSREEVRVYRDVTDRPEDADPIAAEQKTRANFQKRQETQFLPHTLPNKDKADLVVRVHAKPLDVPTPKTKFEFTYDLLPKAPPVAPPAA